MEFLTFTVETFFHNIRDRPFNLQGGGLWVFFVPPPNSEIFFINIVNQDIEEKKQKHNPSPPSS
jgi:hypothetical protein